MVILGNYMCKSPCADLEKKIPETQVFYQSLYESETTPKMYEQEKKEKLSTISSEDFFQYNIQVLGSKISIFSIIPVIASDGVCWEYVDY